MQADLIQNLLPRIYRNTRRAGNPLDAILRVMEDLHGPDEQILDDFPKYLDPRRTPDRFVPMLATWLDLNHVYEHRQRGKMVNVDEIMPTGLGRLRELVANAAQLSRDRGSCQGLVNFLRIATGLRDFHVEENCDQEGRDRPFHICVRGPLGAESLRSFIEDLIRSEKPAHVTFEFVVVPEENGHVD
jgi:phage tail-like protein